MEPLKDTRMPTSNLGPCPEFRAVLFDIDGTLMRAARRGEYRALMGRLLVKVFGTEGILRRVDFSGRTDLAIFREALEPEGIGREDIRAKLTELRAQAADVLPPRSGDTAIFNLCPGVGPLLDRLSSDRRFVLAILSGNLEELARAKLRSAGIDTYFPVRGAYGSDAEDRNELPAIASERLGEQLGTPVPPQRIVIVGDTPRDIECARRFGTRVLAVATGIHGLEDLRRFQPDALLEDLSDTTRVTELLAMA
jgi:phosphoglycolate phosphatase-like HAD superfamily hydrolase